METDASACLCWHRQMRGHVASLRWQPIWHRDTSCSLCNVRGHVGEEARDHQTQISGCCSSQNISSTSIFGAYKQPETILEYLRGAAKTSTRFWYPAAGASNCADTSAWKSSIQRFIITEKAPTRAFSWLKAATAAFTFKTHLRHRHWPHGEQMWNWALSAKVIRDKQVG